MSTEYPLIKTQFPLESFWKYGDKHSSQNPVLIWQNWQLAKHALELAVENWYV